MEHHTHSNTQRKKLEKVTEAIFSQLKRWKGVGKSVREMAQLSGVGKSAIYNAIRKFEENEPASYAELYKKRGFIPKDHSHSIDLIRRIIGEKATLTQQQIQVKLKAEGMELPMRRIGALLNKARIKRKRVKRRPSVVLTDAHKQRVMSYCQLIQNTFHRMISFLHESGFNLHG